MKTFEQAGVVLALAETLRKNGSWTGETHIQKAAYLLQHLLHVPLGLKFVFYKHGPFSFDLRSTLTFMEAEDLVAWKPQRQPYGPSLIPGFDADYVRKRYASVIDEYRPRIEFLAERIGSKTVKDLEKLATALWVIDHGAGVQDCAAGKIVELKPHVREHEAAEALAWLDDLQQETGRRFPV